MSDVNTQFRDFLLRQNHYIRRFENGTVRGIAGHYDEAKKRIVDQINKLEVPGPGFTREWRLQRLRNISDEINIVLDNANIAVTSEMTSSLQEFAATHADVFQGELGDLFRQVNVTLNRLPVEQVFSMVDHDLLGIHYRDSMMHYRNALLWHNADAVRTIKNRLTQVIITGEDMATARSWLLGRGYYKMAGKVGDITTRRAGVIARTEIQRISNAVSRAVYDQNDDVIKGLQAVSTLDRRTCIQCASLDGRIWYFNSNIDSAPSYPIHPNCRCLLSPITKSWQELGIAKEDLPPGTRASWTGQVPEKETYADWLARQEEESPGFAKDVLGKTRYGMWKNGKLKLNEMAKDNKIIKVGKLKERR